MARLVIFTSGTLGDHLPYLALATALQERGHDVLMVINQAMHEYAERAGLKAVALTDVDRGPQQARDNAWAWDHLRYRPDQPPDNAKAEAQNVEDFARQVQELAGFAQGADLLLATAIRTHGLAAHLISGVPWVTLSVNPSAFALTPHSPAWRQQAEQSRLAYNERFRPLLDLALRQAGSSAILPAWSFGCLWAPHVILGSSPAFYRPNRDLLQPSASLDQTGFWYWHDPQWAAWQPSAQLAAFCEQKPLVLAFSSQPLEEPRDVLRRHVRAAAALRMPLVVQRGWAAFDEADLPPEAGDVLFIDYAPHDWLFSRASVAIQHGGIGSLARALYQFCPLVIEPFGNDQFFNAGRVSELGVGVILHPHESTEAQLVQAIEQARSKRVRLRARLVGRALREEEGVADTAALVEEALRRGIEAPRGAGSWGRIALTQRRAAEAAVSKESSAAASEGIPRILHQIWKGEEIPAQFAAWHESWRVHHPQWELRLWTDDACRAFIAEFYPWFLPVYDGYDETIKRVDAMRYFLMHRFGGVYVDLDYEALRPLDPLLAGRELVLCPEPPVHMQFLGKHLPFNDVLSNAFLASTPGHPFWEHLFEYLLAWRAAEGTMEATGPHLLTRAYEGYGDRQAITIEAHQLLQPISGYEPWAELPPLTRAIISRDAYAIHHWYGTWWIEKVIGDETQAQVLERGHQLQPPRTVTRAELSAFGAAMEEKPLISCLMVTRERPLLAQIAVTCFRQQSYTARELIIVDDGPGEELAEWIAANPDPRIRYLRLPDEGRPLGALRNVALEEARGEYIAQWDDDDLSPPLRLLLQMAAIARFETAGCLLARQLLWLPSERRLAKSTYRLWEGSALLPREAMQNYPQTRRGEDTAVLQRIVAQERLVLLDMPELYIYTFHGSNTFEAAHWQQHWQQATVRYQGVRYEPALAELQEWLGLRMGRLHSYLSRRTAEENGDSERPAAIDAQAAAAVVESPAPAAESLPEALPPILILTPLKDAAPHLPTYLTNVQRFDYPPELLSIAFLESDSSDNTGAMVDEALPDLRRHFRRADYVRRDYGYYLSGPRWEQGIQDSRREVLARSRNALLQHALRDEAWVLWIDVDVFAWPADVIKRLLSAGKRIVVPNCLQAEGDESFDWNSFKFAAQGGPPRRARSDERRFQTPRADGRLFLSDLRDQEMVELDGVGGTMLLVDADLHRDGLIFPPFKYKGFLETEGLAQMARDMGVRCWGLPNVIIRHSAL